MRVVVVGNSIAGIEAALAVRARDAEAQITVISAEHPHPFARVSLLYVFCGQLSLKDTEFHDRGLYDRMRFVRVTDRVVAVDPVARRVRLAAGAPIPYDRLLLAVGSRARRLPWPAAYEGPGVHHFVTLADLAALDAAARPGLSVAVIGGGLIGVEVAEVLRGRGLRTHFLVREPWYFPVALDEREAEVVAAHIRAHGVDCRTGAAVRAWRRDGDRHVLGLPDGELTVDLVVGTTGVVPATDFLEGSGIAVNAETGGVEVGDDLQSTNTPGVYAAGDCAQVTWPDGDRRPEQIWYTARDQGRAAGRAILGDAVTYRRGTWYNSAKFFDLEYTTAGYLPYPKGDRPRRDEGAAGRWTTWYQQLPGAPVTLRIVARDGLVKGFNALGSRWDHTVWLRWIHERRPLEWVLPRLAEAQYDEELTPRIAALPSATLTEGA